jgi:hypothetical protein
MRYRSAFTLPALAACLVLLGPNVAAAKSAAKTSDSTPSMHVSAATRTEAMKMVPAQADLTRELNARKLHDGQTFEAKLAGKVKLANGPTLPKGTELVGKVVKDQMNASGRSTLTLRFTQAELKNGTKVPIKATIVGLYAGANQYAASGAPAQTPNYWTPKTLQIDQINALHDVDLHSRIAAQNSGVLQSSKNNIRFGPGTEFALAISKRGAQS